MFPTARRVLAIYTAFVLTLVPGRVAESAGTSSVVSRDPSITFVGGTTARRDTVVAAVSRYVQSDLSLPDLEVHIHEDRSGSIGSSFLSRSRTWSSSRLSRWFGPVGAKG